jgi:bifunctional DNA-binding transcriptional regulator/antitoxin component of YhaV-PrlF toxin-antitoxin module
MSKKQIIEVVLEQAPGMNATGITIPFDVEEVFGTKRVPVKATINDVEYRGSIVRMGGVYCLGIPKAFRDSAGVKAGDNIVVTLEADSAPREVAMPDDLVDALKKIPGGVTTWETVSYTVRKEQVRAIEDAKQSETRQRRIEKAVAMVIAKKK